MKKEMKAFVFIIASLLSLGFSINTKHVEQFDAQQKKSTTVISKSNDTISPKNELKERAYTLFKDKIICGYLYDENLSENERFDHTKILVPENRRVSKKKYNTVIDYSSLSSKRGNQDAELFWNIVKEATLNRSTNEQYSENQLSLIDTMKLCLVNENADTVITTLIFGDKYIDLNNEYVARYIKEIKQICAEVKQIKDAELKKAALQQKQIENIKTQSR